MKLVIVISLNLVFLESFIVSVYCTNEKQHLLDENRAKHWLDDDKIKLLKIFYETNTGERNHAKRIQEKWDQLHPTNRRCTCHNLYTRSIDWIEKGEADRLLSEEERQCKNSKLPRKKIKWTSKMNSDIIRFYHEGDLTKWKQSRRMKELWDREYPNYSDITGHQLMVQVRNLQFKGGKSIKKNGIPSTMDEKEDLLRCYHMSRKKKSGQLEIMRNLFIKRYPQFVNASQGTLRRQISYLQWKYPEVYERIRREVSASNVADHTNLPKEVSDSRQQESTSIPTFQKHVLNQGSNQYPGLNYYIPSNHHISKGPATSSGNNFSDVGTINFADKYAIPGADTSHRIIHPDDTGYYSGSKLAQNHLNGQQRQSSKEEESTLDLDLHLR